MSQPDNNNNLSLDPNRQHQDEVHPQNQHPDPHAAHAAAAADAIHQNQQVNVPGGIPLDQVDNSRFYDNDTAYDPHAEARAALTGGTQFTYDSGYDRFDKSAAAGGQTANTFETGGLSANFDNPADLRASLYPPNAGSGGFYSNLFTSNQSLADEEFLNLPVNGDYYPTNTFLEDNQSMVNRSSTNLLNPFEGQVTGGTHLTKMTTGGTAYIQTEDPADDLQGGRTKKRLADFLGNLVFDCPVSNDLLKQYKTKHEEREFCYMRYTAATSDPTEFSLQRFTLRQPLFKPPRAPCELMVVVTMYNEDDVLLGRTLKGVFDNIKYLCSKRKSKVWGVEGWKKVVVTIVSDGRTKINPRARALLACLGVYQDGFAKNMVNDKPVTAHLYEYTTLLGIASVKDGVVKLTNEDTCPIQLLFCLKEKNQKKINSHRWCFQAFGPILQPKVVILLDAGTEPAKRSLYYLWKTFDRNKNVGGACGEIKAMLGPKGKLLINPLVASQNFEYKMSNILDKPTESVFGFISVLPGAFSAYRYEALQNDITGHGPLEAYFKGETLHDSGAGIFTSNMYLAEDRILCFEIVTKRDSKWVLKYVKNASAETDVPDNLTEFILQRRRWLNGSFFAAIYGIFHFYHVFRSRHNPIRILLLLIEFFYNAFNLLVSWFSLGSFFLVFRILTKAMGEKNMYFPGAGKVIALVLLWLYATATVTTFIFSFGNTPKGAKKSYLLIAVFYALTMAYMLVATILLSIKTVTGTIKGEKSKGEDTSFTDLLKQEYVRNLTISVLATYALYTISSIIFLDPWHMITSFVQYLLLSPAYINILNVYAFCNVHDISWGTKGDDGIKTDLGVVKQSAAGTFEIEIPTTDEEIDAAYKKEAEMLMVPAPEDGDGNNDDAKFYYAFVRSILVITWIISNVAIIAIVLTTGNSGYKQQIFLTVILYAVAFMAVFRSLGCAAYLLLRAFGK